MAKNVIPDRCPVCKTADHIVELHPAIVHFEDGKTKPPHEGLIQQVFWCACGAIWVPQQGGKGLSIPLTIWEMARQKTDETEPYGDGLME